MCSSYVSLNDSWRRINYENRGEFPAVPEHCDNSDIDGSYSSSYINLTSGWYRFTGAAGTKLPTAPAPRGGPSSGNQICGTNVVPYISSGDNPTIEDGIVNRDVCWEWGSHNCEWKSTVKVAACRDAQGDYLVYELQPAPGCAAAYCAIP